jgi:hypothetical protein
MSRRTGRPAAGEAAETATAAIENLDRSIQEPIRSNLKELLLRIARSHPKDALRCADNAAGILHQLSPSQQSVFLHEGAGLSDFPQAAAAFFLCCAEPARYLEPADMHTWVEQGRSLAETNPDAAVAYFRLESAASLSALEHLRRSVHIAEVGRTLKLYCTAAGGRAVGVKSTAEAPGKLVRHGHHLPLTDGETVYLPECLNTHSSRRGNFDEYKILAAHQAGYIEFGTFELDIDVLLDHSAFAAFAKPTDHDQKPVVSHYEIFFGLFEDRRLARDIFFAVEDGRVDFLLRERYRGLASDLSRVAGAALEERPAPSALPLREALVESLVRLSISGSIDESLPHETLPLYRQICAQFSRVLNIRATVTDSAVATARLYALLGALPNLALQSPVIPSAREQTEEPVTDARTTGEPHEAGIILPKAPDDDVQPYHPAQPVPYRGQTSPELVQMELAVEMLRDALVDARELGIPLSREMLEELLKRGVKIKISQMSAKELADASGLFITDLDGVVQEKLEPLSAEEKKRFAKLLQQASVIRAGEPAAEPAFFYDEWDYLINDYRPRWCRLRELPLESASSEIVSRIRKENSALITAVRRRFQKIRPEMLRRVKRLRNGEEIELNDAVEAVIDRRAGITPSDRIYQQRERKMRDVATAFLLDLSASTDEWVVKSPAGGREQPVSASRKSIYDIFAYGSTGRTDRQDSLSEGARRVIDIEREAVVIMAEALQSLGDEYAIYGFSGYGRDNVEFFCLKEFFESYSGRVAGRIGAIKPRKSTRMGPAIRHTLKKLENTDSRLKVLILLSDGYPQDFDYGPDRTSRDYGLHDTAMALQEARRQNVHTFCVTVDQAGNDYLREMCGGENYLVVKRPSALPRILPQVYRGLTV